MIPQNNPPLPWFSIQNQLDSNRVDHEQQIAFLSQDDVLATIISQVDLPKIHRTGDVFHDLMSCVLEQQIHYRSSKRIFEKMLATAEIDRLTLDNFEEFAAKGISNYKLPIQKLGTVQGIVDFFSISDINWTDLPDEEVRKTLTSLKGISNWTADMILLYTLGRADIFPFDDYHVKQVMNVLFELETGPEKKSEMRAISDHWKPYRSLATRYLLAWKDAQKRR